jgi:hypothetical protein
VGFFGWVFYCQPWEQALPEIDKRLNVELELRKLARKEGRRYCDPVALTYQSERMPEPLRSKVGQVPTVQVQAALLFSVGSHSFLGGFLVEIMFFSLIFCTCCLYGAGRYDFDAGNIHYTGH